MDTRYAKERYILAERNRSQYNSVEWRSFLEKLHYFLADEAASKSMAEALAKQIEKALQLNRMSSGLIVYLKGDLGAGKSYLSRALIQYFLPGQKVKSPTYTLVESYPVELEQGDLMIHHFDLYRLCEPEELEYLAIRDILQGKFLALVEWPQNGQPVLPNADLLIEIQHLDEGRNLSIRLQSDKGQQLMQSFEFGGLSPVL
ncbi:tRNA (adenosine(37)-N6)-threonylcarbamoyltransferase complex ATPase subunit type 1 TsaE [Thiomicrorhabdus sp. 6S2-11]|uniref:tRNA threonylcarbamoyladenosine biosynthesis protein TsaE n=1 Tax=Thiomicrorhabdus marina TaxID=2818442 RepID=A0ABS3Q1A8_9GAMM|nr:tRNA (adenosine(37)-N6)-threonylcarbamoyltransferase complex ATPase subunit type 1 TsaE [Thiomicrorhabdus marina]